MLLIDLISLSATSIYYLMAHRYSPLITHNDNKKKEAQTASALIATATAAASRCYAQISDILRRVTTLNFHFPCLDL